MTKFKRTKIVYPLNFKFPGQIIYSKTIKTHPNNEKFNINMYLVSPCLLRETSLSSHFTQVCIFIKYFSFHIFFFHIITHTFMRASHIHTNTYSHIHSHRTVRHRAQYYYKHRYLHLIISHQPQIYTIYYFPFIINYLWMYVSKRTSCLRCIYVFYLFFTVFFFYFVFAHTNLLCFHNCVLYYLKLSIKYKIH